MTTHDLEAAESFRILLMLNCGGALAYRGRGVWLVTLRGLA